MVAFLALLRVATFLLLVLDGWFRFSGGLSLAVLTKDSLSPSSRQKALQKPF